MSTPPVDLASEVQALRQDNARLASEVQLIRRRSGWILLLAALLFVFGSCATNQADDSQVRDRIDRLQHQVTGGDSPADTTPGSDVRSVQLEQCQMIGRIGKALKASPVDALAEGATESACAARARAGFTGADPTP